MTERLTEIRNRWLYLRDVPFKSHSDFVRLGEQAFADMAILLELCDAARYLPLEEILEEVWNDGNAARLDGTTEPGRHVGEKDDAATDRRDRVIRTALEKLGETSQPPLGYVVLDKRPTGSGWAHTLASSFAWPSLTDADRSRQDLQESSGVPADRLAIGEIREVHP
ncbi:hypothetical protein [Nocardia sp. NPDC052566]|uniref:hypothetical protein n=1 Tax=Nocardia sp. NPDC052566 TaxID=3364330 RepID=UPI0037C55750